MRPHSTSVTCPTVSLTLQPSDELAKRIRKLRWIGMEEEARALEQPLRELLPSWPALRDPFDTD